MFNVEKSFNIQRLLSAPKLEERRRIIANRHLSEAIPGLGMRLKNSLRGVSSWLFLTGMKGMNGIGKTQFQIPNS